MGKDTAFTLFPWTPQGAQLFRIYAARGLSCSSIVALSQTRLPPRFTFPSISFSIPPGQPRRDLSQSLVTVWNSGFTHCLPRTLLGNTVCSTPDGILRWGGFVALEVRCGAIRNRMQRKQGNRINETYKRISRRSLLRRLGRINPR